jgi:hypothetical protein
MAQPPFVLGTDSPGNVSVLREDGGVLDVIATPASDISSVVPTTFVFRPGGVAGANVYTTWASLYAVLSTVAGPKIVEVDDALAPAHMTAGAYNVESVTFQGVANDANGAGLSILTVDAGVTWGLPRIVQFNTIELDLTAPAVPLIEVGAGAETWIILSNSSIQVLGGTSYFIDVNNTGFADVLVTLDSIIGDGTHAICNANTGPFNLFVLAFAVSTVQANAVVGAGANVRSDDSSQVQAQGAGVTTSLLSLASRVAYTPANAGSWPTPPTTAAAGLDDLAGVVQKTATYSVAAGHVLSNTDALAKLQIPTGVLGGAETITLPNTIGAVWDFCLSQVTLGANTLTFSTGSGTTAAITAAELASTGATGCRIAISASNRVERLS